jgi:metallopeptidase MepB
MLEQWCFHTSGLKALSSHYQTGEQIPDEMMHAQLATKTTSGLSTLINMLRIALWDLEVYSATGPVDLSEAYVRQTAMLGVIGPEDKSVFHLLLLLELWTRNADLPARRHGYVRWRNLMHPGEVSMYSYMWSKVHAMDMFDAAFQANPMDGVAGRRYRHMVLEKGGSQDEMKTLTDFLGREPSSEAYFRDLNLD